MRKSWSYADDRRVIELAKASKSLEEAARIMKRTPERIRQVARRLGVSLKPTGKTDVVAKRNPNRSCEIACGLKSDGYGFQYQSARGGNKAKAATLECWTVARRLQMTAHVADSQRSPDPLFKTSARADSQRRRSCNSPFHCKPCM